MSPAEGQVEDEELKLVMHELEVLLPAASNKTQFHILALQVDKGVDIDGMRSFAAVEKILSYNSTNLSTAARSVLISSVLSTGLPAQQISIQRVSNR